MPVAIPPLDAVRRCRGEPRVPLEAMIGEASVAGRPGVGPAGREEFRLFRGEVSELPDTNPRGQFLHRVRSRPGADDLATVHEERLIPGRDDRACHPRDRPARGKARAINRAARVAAPMPAPGDMVRSARFDHALVLTIDNLPVNVLSSAVLEALAARLTESVDDPEVRAVVLSSAAEKAFAAGANIREMAPMGPGEAFEHGRRGQALTRVIERLPLPVIAAVHGVCYGGGCEVALACDFIVASTDAQFGQPEVNLGIMPGWGGTRRLPRRVGAARARRWILAGRPVTAEAAEAAGLVDRVVPRSDLLSTSLALAEELATKSALALAAAKYALLESIDPGIDDGLAYELDLWAKLFGTRGQREGMEAFLAKRPPVAVPRSNWEEESAGFPWAHPGDVGNARGKRKKSEASGRD